MSTTGWAIKTVWTDPITRQVHTGFLGKHYFYPGLPPHHFDGYLTAVFATRELAREASRVAGTGYDHATAVRVEVSVVEAQG
jgi:hypothetical protein